MFITPADICTAFNQTGVIGSKVTDHASFMTVLGRAVRNHDFSQERIPGQAFIKLPEASPFVSCGSGRHQEDPQAYVLRTHRGRVNAYLSRKFAVPTENCAVVVYTLEAYLSDPDITPEEASRVTLGNEGETVYVIVAVLATAGPQSQLSPFRLVHNLAGGNKEAQVWSADEIRAKAHDVLEYDNEWATVADPC